MVEQRGFGREVCLGVFARLVGLGVKVGCGTHLVGSCNNSSFGFLQGFALGSEI